MWQGWQHPGGMMMGADGGGWFWGMAMHAAMAGIFLAILIVVIVLLVRWLARSADGYARPAADGSGLDILDARYARGEIERDEYLQRKKDIARLRSP